MPASPSDSLPVVPVSAARRLLLGGQGLLADPTRRATPAVVRRAIEGLGFVQMDTINVVERAHHHILGTRLDGYRPRMLEKLLERDRSVFEHWTHDASIVPTRWLPWWRHRFERYRRAGHSANPWWARLMGPDPDRVIEHVLERIEAEGPRRSADFAHTRPAGERGTWWGWKPQKAALEYLWRTGRVAVVGRENFHKVYDLAERVFPDLATGEAPDDRAHLDWACRAALDRLGVATTGELAAYLAAVSPAAARTWAETAVRDGAAVPVQVEAGDGTRPRRALARPDWRRRAAGLPAPPERLRLLSPFDPVVRDRGRAQRLFGFDYRFEAFVPATKRRYGYYVLPLLERDRFVGRLDAKLHRDRGELEIRGLWWEPGLRPTAERRRALECALGRFTASLGVDRFRLPARARKTARPASPAGR